MASVRVARAPRDATVGHGQALEHELGNGDQRSEVALHFGERQQDEEGDGGAGDDGRGQEVQLLVELDQDLDVHRKHAQEKAADHFEIGLFQHF